MKRFLVISAAVIVVAAIAGGSIAAAGGATGVVDANEALEAVSVSAMLADPAYGTQVAIYGQVSLMGELFCPCFELLSGNGTVMVWYDLMVDEDGEARPVVSVEGIENGDWVVVTGELQPGGTNPGEFWAGGIDKAVSVDADDDGGEVALAAGDLLVVTLESNPTTGYSWSLAGGGQDDVLAFAGNEFIAPESTEPLVGQGGVEVWAFQAVAEGGGSVSMEYIRPWEQGVEPEDTFNITVVVE
jgi:inhibitor of cysteine peptidase